jgi:hypothetical protein
MEVIITPFLLFSSTVSMLTSIKERREATPTSRLCLKVVQMVLLELPNLNRFIMVCFPGSASIRRRANARYWPIKRHIFITYHLEFIFIILQRIVFTFLVHLFDPIHCSISKYILLFPQEFLIGQVFSLMHALQIVLVFQLSLRFYLSSHFALV